MPEKSSFAPRISEEFAVERLKNNMEMSARRRNLATTATLLLLCFAFEFLLFDQMGAHRHTRVYPRWNDQIQYLTEVYAGYEEAQAHGYARGLWSSLVNPSAQGTLHDFSALVVFGLTGPSRSAALSLNLFALVLWQLAAFIAIWRHFGSRPLAWLAVFALLALKIPWSDWAGSAFDFRLDWMTAAWFGATLAAAQASRGFRSLRGSLVFGAATAVTLLLRFLTGTYFFLIYAVFSAWVLMGENRLPRFRNLLLAAGIAAALAGPILWLNRTWVYNYYWIGHFIGPESALRSSNMGVLASLRWITNEVLWFQLGSFILCSVFGIAVVLLAGTRFAKSPTPATHCEMTSWWVPTTVFWAAPFAVLTLHQQKSPVVLSILLPGLMSSAVALWYECGKGASAQIWAGTRALAAIAFATFFVARMNETAYSDAFAADARKVNQLADYIFDRSQRAHLANPRVAVDRVTDCLDAQVLRVITYERHRKWVPYIMTLPTGIFEEQPSLIAGRAQNSDFVFLTESGPPGQWPYDRQLERLRPTVRAWCNEHLKLVERFEIFGLHLVLYQRPEIP